MDNIAQIRKSYQKYVLCHSVALNYNYHHTKTSRLIAKKMLANVLSIKD